MGVRDLGNPLGNPLGLHNRANTVEANSSPDEALLKESSPLAERLRNIVKAQEEFISVKGSASQPYDDEAKEVFPFLSVPALASNGDISSGYRLSILATGVFNRFTLFTTTEQSDKKFADRVGTSLFSFDEVSGAVTSLHSSSTTTYSTTNFVRYEFKTYLNETQAMMTYQYNGTGGSVYQNPMAAASYGILNMSGNVLSFFTPSSNFTYHGSESSASINVITHARVSVDGNTVNMRTHVAQTNRDPQYVYYRGVRGTNGDWTMTILYANKPAEYDSLRSIGNPGNVDICTKIVKRYPLASIINPNASLPHRITLSLIKDGFRTAVRFMENDRGESLGIKKEIDLTSLFNPNKVNSFTSVMYFPNIDAWLARANTSNGNVNFLVAEDGVVLLALNSTNITLLGEGVARDGTNLRSYFPYGNSVGGATTTFTAYDFYYGTAERRMFELPHHNGSKHIETEAPIYAVIWNSGSRSQLRKYKAAVNFVPTIVLKTLADYIN